MELIQGMNQEKNWNIIQDQALQQVHNDMFERIERRTALDFIGLKNAIINSLINLKCNKKEIHILTGISIEEVTRVMNVYGLKSV